MAFPPETAGMAQIEIVIDPAINGFDVGSPVVEACVVRVGVRYLVDVLRAVEPLASVCFGGPRGNPELTRSADGRVVDFVDDVVPKGAIGVRFDLVALGWSPVGATPLFRGGLLAEGRPCLLGTPTNRVRQLGEARTVWCQRLKATTREYRMSTRVSQCFRS